MSLWIALGLIAVVVIWAIAAFNRLILLKNQVLNAWQQIDVQLKRRHDLIPNLVATVKGAFAFEQGTLEAVVNARTRAVSATGVPEVAKAEGELSAALGRLFALSEAYPELKSLGNAAQLQTELSQTETLIASARQHYNEVATIYNTVQAQVPTTFVAGIAHATPAELWEIDEAEDRSVPKVDLSTG